MKYLKLREQEIARIIAQHLAIKGVEEYSVEFATDLEGRPFALVLLPAEKPVVPNPYPDRIGEESTRDEDAPIKRGTPSEDAPTRVEDSADIPVKREAPEDALTSITMSEPRKRPVRPKKPDNVAADILGGDGGILDRAEGLGAGLDDDRRRSR